MSLLDELGEFDHCRARLHSAAVLTDVDLHHTADRHFLVDGGGVDLVDVLAAVHAHADASVAPQLGEAKQLALADDLRYTVGT